VLLGAQHDDRDVRLVRVEQVADPVCRARRHVQLDHPRLARRARVAHRRADRDVLVQARHIANFVGGHARAVDQRDLVRAGHPEQAFDAQLVQALKQYVSTDSHPVHARLYSVSHDRVNCQKHVLNNS
jgi:hypothetical protein